MVRGLAGQVVGAEVVNATTGAAFAGTVTVYVTIDNGAQALGSVSAGVATAKGNGLFNYLPSLAETDGALVAFTFVGTGAIPVTIEFPTITAAQTSALATATGSLSISTLTLVTDALRELRVLNAADVASGEDADFALRKLNRLLDRWNANRQAVYAESIVSYALTPSLQPHTIGPSSATYTVTQRPVAIEGANLILTSSTPNLHVPITVHREAAWWLSLSAPTLTSSVPTDLWYSADWPNGSIYLWPVPTTAYRLELLTRLVLGQLALADTFWLPPGYQDALTLSLAEACARPFGVPLDPELKTQASFARAQVFANNDPTPRLQTCDAGMPSGGGGFNYLTGNIR